MLQRTLVPIEDDTEDAPWMVMGSAQFWATTRFADALENELVSRDPPLFVTGMLPILYYPIPGGRQEKLAPDVLVARVPVHDRSSFDLDQEGVAPAFVLEVISPNSYERDLDIKPARYERMGVDEYALFAPSTPVDHLLLNPHLQGYRRDSMTGEFMPWEADERGRLYSTVLELWLVERNGELRAQRPDGSFLLTLREERRARLEAVRARDEESRARDEEARARTSEARARQAAEAEVARLRTALENQET